MTRNSINVFDELSEKCSEADLEITIAIKAGHCPHLKDLEELMLILNDVINEILTLQTDLKKCLEVGNRKKPLEILKFIVTEIKSLEKDLSNVLEKSFKECSKSTQCCLVAPLLKSVLEKLDWCAKKLKKIIELVSEGGCEKCLYYSKTTGLCLKTRKKTYGIPICGGVYFKKPP